MTKEVESMVHAADSRDKPAAGATAQVARLDLCP